MQFSAVQVRILLGLCSCLNFYIILQGGRKEHIFTKYKMKPHPLLVDVDYLNYSINYNVVSAIYRVFKEAGLNV